MMAVIKECTDYSEGALPDNLPPVVEPSDEEYWYDGPVTPPYAWQLPDYKGTPPMTAEEEIERESLKLDFWNMMLEEGFRNETYLNLLYRPDYSCVPSYLKVRNQSDDAMFLQQVSQSHIPWNPPPLEDTAVKYAAALKLWDGSALLELFYQELKDANLLEAFDNAIRTALTVVYKLYTKETLYKIGLEREKQQQRRQLWDRLAMLGRKGGSLSEAYEEIVELVTDEKTYYLVTESDVAGLLEIYKNERCEPNSNYDEPNIDEIEEDLFKHIETVVQMEPLPSKLEDDLCTQWVIGVLKEIYIFEEGDLIEKLVGQTKGICDLEEDLRYRLNAFLFSLFDDARNEMKYHLVRVIKPMVSLSNPANIIVPPQVLEVIQVAELRRMVLGGRFIGRSHLVWAFYECGCGLPSAITKKVYVNFADEDRPPYHIYSAAIKLAECLGEKNMGLEHFIFAVLYTEDIGDDLDKMIKFKKHFKEFLQDLKRSSENLCSDVSDITPMEKSRFDDVSKEDECTSSSFTEQMSWVGDMLDWD